MCSVGSNKKYPVQIESVVGELLRAVHITEANFTALQGTHTHTHTHTLTHVHSPSTHIHTHTDKLKGMHENSSTLSSSITDPGAVKSAVLEVANVAQVPSSDSQTLRFAGVTFSSQLPVLIMVQLGSKVIINSEKVVINGVLLKNIKRALSSS